jgi:hypothetical protein
LIYQKELPSGKQPHNYGKSAFFTGKLMKSMAIYNFTNFPKSHGHRRVKTFKHRQASVSAPESTVPRKRRSTKVRAFVEGKKCFKMEGKEHLMKPKLVGGFNPSEKYYSSQLG